MVIVLLANGFEELEALTPVDVLRRNNIDVRTVSITNDKLVTGTHGIQVAADLLSSDVPLDQVDLLILPGGMPGVKNLDVSPITQMFIDATLRNNGRLAAICAAPSIFGKHGMLTNIKATCFPGFEGEMHNAILMNTEVVTDGIFTTARDYRAATAFADELVRVCDSMSIMPHDESEAYEEPVSGVLEFDFSLLDESELIEITKEEEDHADCTVPPIDLLGLNDKTDGDDTSEITETANIIIETLSAFGVSATIRGVDRGPRITRYEIVPAKGVKVNSVVSLYHDIALNLAKEGIRMEAPIPGKSAIGLEVPNSKPEIVRLGELISSETFTEAKSKTFVAIGKDVAGEPVFGDIAKLPHLLISGATGMGKSVCINSILISILYKAKPDEVKFIMIDPKKVEFNGYNGIPHLLVPVVTDVKQAAGALMWAVEQMEKRYDLMEALEVRKLDAYNEKVRENPELGEPLPKIVIVIDELNDIMLQVRKPAEDLIMSIAQKARAAGIHLIIGTQRPSVDVITGVIKANIPSRISCKVASYNDSKTILEQAGAEKLLNNGDMLYIPAGAPKALRVQGAFVSDGEVAAIMKFLKSQAKGNVYDAQALEDINRAAQKCSKGKGGGDDYGDDDDRDDEDNAGILNDQQFLDAVELAVKSGKISTSLIQRKISIGYGKAAKFIDYMEDMGIVSEPNGQKPRDVLVTKDEWHEMLSRRSLD